MPAGPCIIKIEGRLFYEVILFCELHCGSRFVSGVSGVKSSAWRRRWRSRGRRRGVGVTDLAAPVLVVMVWAHPGQVSAGAALVRDSAGRVDLRVEVFLVGQMAVASVIAVSVGEIAAFAIVGFAISKETLSILVFMALDIQIITNTATHITTHTHTTTDTRITTRTRITTISVDSAGGATDHLNPVKIASVVGRNSSIRARLVMLVSRSSRDDKSGVCFRLKPATGQ